MIAGRMLSLDCFPLANHPRQLKTQANFCCVSCGHHGNADVIAAINILARGQRVLACGESSLEDLMSHKESPSDLGGGGRQEEFFATIEYHRKKMEIDVKMLDANGLPKCGW
jgi:hypothetical protein